MEYILGWRKFYENNNLIKDSDFIHTCDPLILEAILKTDSFRENPPEGSALLNLPNGLANAVLSSRNTTIREDRGLNMYPLYFNFNTKESASFEMEQEYLDHDDDDYYYFYEFDKTFEIAEAKSLKTSLDPINYGLDPKGGPIHVIFRMTGHARQTQWRHGFVVDRNSKGPLKLPFYDINNKVLRDGGLKDISGFLRHPLPRINTIDILKTAKYGFEDFLDCESRRSDLFNTTNFTSLKDTNPNQANAQPPPNPSLPRVLSSMRFYCQRGKLNLVCQVEKLENIYQFTIITVWAHPNFYEPGGLENILNM